MNHLNTSARALMQRNSGLIIPVIGFILIVGVIVARQPMAASYVGLNLILAYATPLIFVVMAQMLIMSIGDIDLGIGQFVSLTMCLSAALMDVDSRLAVVGLTAAVAAYAALGAAIHVFSMPSIVATLGGAFVWYGCALTIFPTPGGSVPEWLAGFMKWHTPVIPLPIIVIAAVGLIMQFTMMNSSLGTVIRGLGGNPRAVERAGWSPLLIRVLAYGGAGSLAAIGGVLLSGLTMTGDANVGSNYTLQSIAAVIIGGGRFSGGVVLPIGAAVGALTILLTGTLLSFANVSPNWQLSVQGAILILVLSLRRFVENK